MVKLQRKTFHGVKCICSKLSQSSCKGMGVFGVFSHFFLLSRIQCAAVKSSAVCNQMFPGSVTVINLCDSLQSSNLKDFFPFNCWSLVLTFPMICSVAAMQRGSTSWFLEVAHSYRFFPFKILCKVNRGVKTVKFRATVLWSNNSASVYSEILKVHAYFVWWNTLKELIWH